MADATQLANRQTRDSVFISYSHEDVAAVNVIKKACASLQITAWIDRESLRGGQRWQDSIHEAIRGASVFVACLSANYFRNPNSFIVDELACAFNELKKRPRKQAWFLPIKIGSYERSAVPIAFRRALHKLQIVDVTADVDAGLTEYFNIILPITKPDVYWAYLFKHVLGGHIQSKIAHFSESRVQRINQVEDRWKALLQDHVIKPLSTTFIQVREKAQFTGAHQIEQLYLEDMTLLISCVPHLDVNKFKAALPCKGNDLPDRYFQFVLDRLRDMMSVKGWERRDLVHLVYFEEKEDSILDVCFVVSFNLAMTIAGYMLTRRAESGHSDGATPITYEEMYPTFVTDATEHTRFINIVRPEQGSAMRSRLVER